MAQIGATNGTNGTSGKKNDAHGISQSQVAALNLGKTMRRAYTSRQSHWGQRHARPEIESSPTLPNLMMVFEALGTQLEEHSR
jgi:hypothetical protein